MIQYYISVSELGHRCKKNSNTHSLASDPYTFYDKGRSLESSVMLASHFNSSETWLTGTKFRNGNVCLAGLLWGLSEVTIHEGRNMILAHAAAAKSLQSCPTLCNPMDCSLPGFSVHGILQARTLEWVAIFFSNVWKWSHSVVCDS